MTDDSQSSCPCGHIHGSDSGAVDAEWRDGTILVTPADRGEVGPLVFIRDRDRLGQRFEVSASNHSIKVELTFKYREGELVVNATETTQGESTCTRDAREALVLRVVQSAFRLGLENITFENLNPFSENFEPLDNKSVDTASLAKKALKEYGGLTVFRAWVEYADDAWETCLKLANGYWTRCQVQVLASEPLRGVTTEMVAGIHKPDFPSFPPALLDVEFLGYWELAGCLRNWSAQAGRESQIEISHRHGGERFPEHLLRASARQRLQGTVETK